MNNKEWNKIKPNLIQKSFKRCTTSNNLDGTEDRLQNKVTAMVKMKQNWMTCKKI